MRKVDVGEEVSGPAEHEDAAAHLDRLLELVGDDDGGVALRARELDERLAQRGRRHLVEVAERLVGEQQRRLDDERARERDALAHAARKARADRRPRSP